MQSEIPVAPLFVFIYFYTHKVGIRAVINQEDFIRRLQQREKEAFQELFYSWHRPLCFFASRIIKDQDVAEDLVQDVFVAFWKYDLSAFPNEKTIRTFLYTSVRNGCLNYLRDLEIRARNDRKAVPESEVVTELFEAIDELLERCREIFYMAYLQEKEEKQIAELLRVSVNTVKTQKQRAKAYLKGRLGELFVYMTLFFFEF